MELIGTLLGGLVCVMWLAWGEDSMLCFLQVGFICMGRARRLTNAGFVSGLESPVLKHGPRSVIDARV